MQAFFRFLTSAVFHVKPLQGECSAHTCMGITEPQEVGHKVSKQLQTEEAAGNLFTDIFEVQQVGSEGANIVQKKNKAIHTLTVFAQALCWSARLWKACKHTFRSIRLNKFSTFIKMLSTYIL